MNAQSPVIQERAGLIYDEAQWAANAFTDRLFAVLMVVQWLGAIAAALWLSPLTWAGPASWVHPHVWWAFGMGGLLTVFPVAMALKRPGELTTRLVITFAQTSYSALLIHLTGGRIETHFHVFGSLAFLAFYRDFRVLALATAIVAIDHFVRGVWFPASVFGVANVSPFRWVEHAAWVLFEDAFLYLSIRRGLAESRTAALRQATIEHSHQLVEEQVASRTAELVAANSRANEALRIKGLFLSKMSHELRTPLNAVIGFADLLTEPNLETAQRCDHARAVRKNGQRLLGLVESILDSVAVGSGSIRINRVATRPMSLIHACTAEAAAAAQARGIEFKLVPLEDADTSLMTDPDRLRQIVCHLVENALKFTEQGTITVSVRVRTTDRLRLFVDVDDTGIGMTAQQQKTLFQPFVQGDDADNRKFEGAGVGLLLARELARSLGGDITAVSNPSVGSTFTLRIDGGEAKAPATPAPAADKPARGLRILYVEDGPDNQRLVKFLLERAGATVEIAENGQIGIEAVTRADTTGQPFDLIFMDMAMPLVDGYEATRHLRQNGHARPIVALTAHANEGDKERCLSAGCSDYITKPVTNSALLEAVGRWSQQQTQNAA